jgi:phosphoglycolate phosphatase-like HAD superfamily hydrolase
MQLVIFDIDGTLTRTNDFDAECFLTVMARYVDLDDDAPDWDSFEYVTDEGIARELLARDGSHLDADATLTRVREEFTAELKRACGESTVQTVPGAVEPVAQLTASRNHCVAIATGSWLPSARLKLTEAGFQFDSLPLATSSDSYRRDEILATAYQRAAKSSGFDFDNVVYVGDGLWDLRAARRLRYGFVGVGCGAHAERLHAAGAKIVVPNFADHRECIEHFRQTAES